MFCPNKVFTEPSGVTFRSDLSSLIYRFPEPSIVILPASSVNEATPLSPSFGSFVPFPPVSVVTTYDSLFAMVDCNAPEMSGLNATSRKLMNEGNVMYSIRLFTEVFFQHGELPSHHD